MHLSNRLPACALEKMSDLATWFRMSFVRTDVVTVRGELPKNLDDKEKRVAVDAQEDS